MAKVVVWNKKALTSLGDELDRRNKRVAGQILDTVYGKIEVLRHYPHRPTQ